MNDLISTENLAARLGDPAPRVVDVRLYLDPARQGRVARGAGHIPGAIFMDLSRLLERVERGSLSFREVGEPAGLERGLPV